MERERPPPIIFAAREDHAMSQSEIRQDGRPLTGRSVALILIAFFLTVASVDFVMVRAAINTFGGLETPSSYKAGLAFNRDLAAARDQAALHWTVDVGVVQHGHGAATITVQPRDAAGHAVPALTLVAQFHHPVDSRRDRPLAFTEVSTGLFRADVQDAAGVWNFSFDLRKNDRRVFRWKGRVSVRQ